MEERTILKKLSQGSQRAMETAVRRYSAYVITVIHNKSQGSLRPEDEEEIAADVFFALWENAASIEPGHIRPWLGRSAATKPWIVCASKNKLSRWRTTRWSSTIRSGGF